MNVSATRSKLEKRLAIMAAADRLFTRYGPIKTSVADIAREMHMSPANIYNFFPSRDALIEAVGEQHLAVLRAHIIASVDSQDDPWAKISILFMTNLRKMRDHLENEKDIVQLQAIAQTNCWQFIVDYHEFLRSRIVIIVRQAVAAGQFDVPRAKLAADALVDCMVSALDPLLMLKIPREEHERRVIAQLSLLERAFRKTDK